MAPRRELEVQAVWHQQVHRSRVATLALAPGGAALWSGCDAAAPLPGTEHNDEAPVALVSCNDGSTRCTAARMPACNVRLLQPLQGEDGAAGPLLCVAGDGSFMLLSEQQSSSGGTEVAVCSSTGLPGTPAGEAAAAAPEASAAGEQQGAAGTGGAAAQPEQQPALPAGPAEASSSADDAAADNNSGAGSTLGPEFVAESGYRGHRQGYLFRAGALGPGYYRKDAVRRYCSAVGVAAAPAVTAAPPTRDAAGPPAGAAAPAPAPPSSSSSGGGGAATTADASASATAGAPGPATPSDEAPVGGAAARRYIQRLLRAPPSMHAALLSPCGVLLYTASLGPRDCSVRVWGLLPGGGGPQPELHRTLHGHTAPVLSLALSPCGGLLFTGSYDQTVRVWSTADWHCLRVLKGHGGGVRAMAVAPDGATLYSAAADNTIRAWSMRHWVCLRTMHGRHDDTTWPACLALSPDGSLLASGSTGPFGASTIKLFQTADGGGREAGDCLSSFVQLKYDQKGGMSALLFSPDGSTLYSGASDGTLAAWQLRWKEAPPAGRPGSGGLRRGFL